MKRKIGRRKRKKQKKILIIISLSLLLFLCVGYAAFSTQLTMSAKGNIKDYNAAWQLLKSVVTQGDGLYKDIYEDGRYVTYNSNCGLSISDIIAQNEGAQISYHVVTTSGNILRMECIYIK